LVVGRVTHFESRAYGFPHHPRMLAIERNTKRVCKSTLRCS
jgi:hypothetical protein